MYIELQVYNSEILNSLFIFYNLQCGQKWLFQDIALSVSFPKQKVFLDVTLGKKWLKSTI